MASSQGFWGAKEDLRQVRRAKQMLALKSFKGLCLTLLFYSRQVGGLRVPRLSWAPVRVRAGRVPPLERVGRQPAAAAVGAPHPRPEVAQARLLPEQLRTQVPGANVCVPSCTCSIKPISHAALSESLPLGAGAKTCKEGRGCVSMPQSSPVNRGHTPSATS